MTKRNKILLGAGGGVAALLAAGALATAGPHGHRGGHADLNRDGQVTSAEITQAARVRFNAFDVNRDGSLAGAELTLMQQERGERGNRRRHGTRGDRPIQPQPPQAQPQEASTVAASAATPAAAPIPRQLRNDFDGNGAISFAEFRRGMATRYMLLDSNGDGTVSAEELKQGRGGRGRS